MKIKSLLIGSAAAVVAAPAAFAADIIIPEPEMVEYVRVCDAAGAGYWYIPGSETCLKISGSVEYSLDFDFDDNPEYPLDFNWVDAAPGDVGSTDSFTWNDPDGNVPFWGAIEDGITDLGIDLGDALGALFPNDPIAAFLAAGGVDVDGGDNPSNADDFAGDIGLDGISTTDENRVRALANALGVDTRDLLWVFDYYLEGDPGAPGGLDDQGDAQDDYFGLDEFISGIDSLEDLQKLKAALIDYDRDIPGGGGGDDDAAPTTANSVTEAALYNAILAFEASFEAAISDIFGHGDANDGFRHGYEAIVAFEAWNDTDLGALYSKIALIGGGSYDETTAFGDNNVEIDVAYFTLGGLHIGYNDSIFDFGVAGVSDDFGGGQTANRISYAFDAGNFKIEGGVEHDSDGDWTPNFVVKGTATVDMFSGELAYAYDDSEQSSHVKGVAKFYGFELGGQWNSGFTGLVPGEYHGRYRWSVAAAYNFKATDTLTITPSIGWGDSVVWPLGYSPYDELSLGVDIGWKPVAGLEIGADIEYRRIQQISGADDLDVGLSIKRSF